MKTIQNLLLITSFMFCVQLVSAQAWKDMMHDPNVNVYDVVREAELYFQQVDKTAKGSGWKAYQRWLFETEPKFYPSGDRSQADPYFASKSYREFQGNNPARPESLFDNGWVELGPYDIGQVTGHYSLGLGRVESFYTDPNDTMRIYLGSRSGGFWKSLDGGATWQGTITDSLVATGVNTMTVSPTNPDSILINVRNARNGTTHGIYRSVDGGNTWLVSNFNPVNLGWGGLGTNRQIYQIAYHPTIPGLVFIGSNEGLYRSADDLGTWTRPIASLDFKAIAFHPTDPNVIYAATSDTHTIIYVSTNGGLTFSASGTITGNGSSIKLSTSAACPNCVFIGSSDGIWKSTNQGQTFGLLSTPGLSNYGAFAVSDVDTNYILFGNIDVNMSADHGANFNKVTYWSQGNASFRTNPSYVHADIRGSRCINGVFWVNTDGFLGKSKDNGVTWQIYEGQSIRENYNLGVSQSNHYRTICGSQDNGTSINTEVSWVEFFGADGMEGIIHPLNDDWMIGSFQYGGRRRTQNGGLTQQGVTPPGQSGAWIAPLFYDPNDQMVVYHIGDTLFRSDNFGTNWVMLGSPTFSGSPTYGTIAENNSDVLVVTRSQRIEKSIDGGMTFTDIRGTLPGNSITDVAFDPNDDDVIVVTYGTYQNNGQKVFITQNQGQTWQNITHNLNDMPIRSVVIDHTDASNIYLGTEIGVYMKPMTGTSWTLYNPGLPNVAVLELEVMYGSNTLRAATWGRGLWEYTLDGRQDYPAILTTTITDPPTDALPFMGVDQYVTSTITYDDTLTSVYVEWSANSPVFGNAISMSNTVDSTWVSDMPIPNQPAGTKVYFKVFAVGTQGDTTETYKFMYEVKTFDYCNSYGNMAYTTAVTLVDFQAIFNSSGKTQPYTDYTSTDTASVKVGETHDLTVNLDTDGNYTIHSKAWIDWNQDADFTDPGEEYDLGTATNTPNGPTNLSPLSILVPLNAQLGSTVMRVSAKYNSDPGPCETGFDGEVEDYTIIINKLFQVDSSSVSICANDSIFLQGSWRRSAGVFYDTVQVSASVDSVYITSLSINPLLVGTDTQTGCDSYFWSATNTTYTTSGSYTATLASSAGCDSVVTLNLTIRQVTTGSETVSACDSYTWPANGNSYTTSGAYTTTLTNAAGCDSVVTLNLTIQQATTGSETVSACDTYTWSTNGNSYTTSGAYTATLTNTAGCDSIVTLNLTINNSTATTETIAACNSYTWDANGTLYTTSGSYTEILASADGCDSTVTLNLTINTLTASVTQSGSVLTADEPGAAYQWVSCPDLTPIAGATGQSFTATANGDFAVIIQKNGCADTSDCQSVTTVGILSNDFGTAFRVYPNPTEGDFSIELGARYPAITVSLWDVNGRLVRSREFADSQLLRLNFEAAAGTYLLRVEAGLKKAAIRLVKE